MQYMLYLRHAEGWCGLVSNLSVDKGMTPIKIWIELQTKPKLPLRLSVELY